LGHSHLDIVDVPMMTRTLVLECSDWPVSAARSDPTEPVAVVQANRVIAVSRAGRMAGVASGLRRREAQARCPELRIISHDPARDAAQFDPVVNALAAIAPRVEVLCSGRVAIPTHGPARYWGGDQPLGELVATRARDVLGERTGATAPPAVGIADSRFAAQLAAQQALDLPTPVAVVPAGANAQFLAPFAVSVLGVPDMADLFRRLGIGTLGQVASFARGDLLARFGPLGDVVHRLASGEDDHPLDPREPAPQWSADMAFEPALDRIDQVAFAAKALADDLLGQLAQQGLACVCLHIELHGAHGEVIERWWRHDRPFTVGAITDRVRWQLEGWLRTGDLRGGIGLVRLRPDQVVVDRGRQLGLWGWSSEVDERAIRGLSRLAALVGSGRVRVPELRGGRQLDEQVALIALESVDLGERLEHSLAVTQPGPWPGRLPTPSPTVLHDPVLRADVRGELPGPVQVSGRGLLSQTPTQVSIGGGPWQAITAWAGPWCIEERWWDATRSRRLARFQVVLQDGIAHVLTVEQGSWAIEASYH
jgi:protein ImuB